MGVRDSQYQLIKAVELDEAFSRPIMRAQKKIRKKASH